MKPKVKLLTLWMLDAKYQAGFTFKEIPNHYISNGIWETRSVEEVSMDGNGKKQRVYTLICVNSHSHDLKQGTEIKMDEAIIIELCHRVKLIHLPKLKSIIKQ